MTEIKHVLLDESVFYFFIGPVYKQLIVKVRLLSLTTREKDRILQICSIPVCLKENAKLLSPSKGKYRYENFTTLV